MWILYSFVSFLNRYCQFQLLQHGLFSSVQCMLGICQFSAPPSCVQLDVLTLCLLVEIMKEIHCISFTSYVVGKHSTVASSTGRTCRGSSFPAGEWQCFLWEEQRECIESVCIHNILVSFYLMLFQLIVWPPPHCLRCVDLQSVTRVNLSEPHITNLATHNIWS